MALAQHRSAGGMSHSRSLLMTLFCLVGTACSATAPTSTAHFEDARGAVFLQHISDQSFHASHPISLEPALLTRVLSGILVQERQRALQAVLAGSSSAVSVFSAEDIQFLVPLIAGALAGAAADQSVGFSVATRRPGGSQLEYATTETTAGSLSAHGSSLYFSLSRYRSAPARTNTESIAHRRLPDPSGLSDRVLLFNPSFAQGSDTFHRPPADAATDQFLVIDYQLLQQASPSAAAPVQVMPRPQQTIEPSRQNGPVLPPSESPLNVQRALQQRDDEVHTLKDLIIKKDLELDALRQELQSIRRQLNEQVTRQDGQKQKNKLPSKQQPKP